MSDLHKVNATPEKSTLHLSLGERVLGDIVELSLPEQPDSAKSDLAADTFWELYQYDPQPLDDDKIADSRRINRRLLDWMRSSGGFGSAQKASAGNLGAASVAASIMYKHITSDDALQEALAKQQEMDELENEMMRNKALADALQDVPEQEGMAQGYADSAKALQEQIQAMMQEANESLNGLETDPLMKASMSVAVGEATQQAKEVSDNMAAWGITAGTPTYGNPQEVTEFLAMMSDDRLKEIAQIAGRIQGIALQARRQKTTVGLTPTSITYSQDPALLLPDSLAGLSHRMPDGLRRMNVVEFVENGLLSWDNTNEGKEKGPFILMLDRSGSMYGRDMLVGLAIALGLARIAKQDGRRYILGTFADEYSDIIAITSEDDWAAHLRWASQRASGGTSFDKALEWGMELLAAMDDVEGTDAVFITDGYCNISDGVYESWSTFNQESGSKLLYVPVHSGGGSDGRISQLADKVLEFSSLDAGADQLAGEIGAWAS